jgi:hypothetical protein
MIKKFGSFNESSVDVDYQSKVEKTKAYRSLSSAIEAAISKFKLELEEEIGYEEGDMDKDLAVSAAIQGATDENYGW